MAGPSGTRTASVRLAELPGRKAVDMNFEDQQRQEGARHLVFLAEELALSTAGGGCLANWKNTRRGVLPQASMHTLMISTPSSGVEVNISDEEVVSYASRESRESVILKIKAALAELY